MPSKGELKQWADNHGVAAVDRVVKRIQRFAGNTTDESTGAAANDLLQLIKNTNYKGLPKEDRLAEGQDD
jgi:hypothetical protein